MKPGEKAEPLAPPAGGGTISDTGEVAAGARGGTADGTLGASYGERLEELSRPSATPPAHTTLDLPVIARERYRELGEHARGGLGRVLRAQDVHLGRAVAIKEMLETAPGSAASARFVREALVTARLQHPGIVPVYDAGYWPGGEPFYAMKLVSGRSLRDAIADAKDLDARLSLLPAVLAAAQAVAYAHSEGIIHRDLKPSNVMLGPFGETVVVDWGLAKDLHAAEAVAEGERPAADVYALSHYDMTRVGAVVGTPGFMPPEQAAGASVDERADVYALGAMLYTLLAGDAPPVSGVPPSIDAVAPGAPRDLVAIVAKAMAAAPEARYPDAGAFAADLSRFLSGQLVGAREYGVLTRVARFFSRRRLPLAVSAVLVALLVVVTVEAFRRVLAARGRAEARSNELVLSQARAYLETDPTASLAWLEQYPADGKDPDGAAALAADAVSRGIARHVLYGPGGAHLQDARVSPDGARIVAADGTRVLFFDAATGQALREVPLPNVLRIGFAPDSRHVVALGERGDVWWLDSDGRASRRLGGHSGWAQLYAFDRGGTRLATAGPAGDVLVFDVAGAGQPVSLAAHTGIVMGLEFSPDGDLFTAGIDGAVKRWPHGAAPAVELASASDQPVVTLALDPQGGVAWATAAKILRHDGRAAREVGSSPSGIRALAVDEEGVVAGSNDGEVVYWSGGKRVSIARLPGNVTALAIGPTSVVAAGDDQGNVVLQRGGQRTSLRGHGGMVRRLGFRPDGSLLSLGDEGSARLWEPPLAHRPLFVGSMDAFRVQWSPKSDALAASDRDGSVRWFPGLTGPGQLLGRHRLSAYGLALDATGTTLYSGGWDGRIGIWSTTGGPARTLEQGDRVWSLDLSRDGRSLAATSQDGVVELWDVATGTGQIVHRYGRAGTYVTFSPDGSLLASAADGGPVHVHDLRGGAPRDLDFGPAGAHALVWSLDGRWLYASCPDGAVRGIEVAATHPVPRVLTIHRGASRTIALSPDGRLLASGGTDGEVRLVELASGRVRVLGSHTDEARHVTFSPDGGLLASAGWDNIVRVWDTSSGAVAILRGHGGKVHRVAFSPDGKWLASASADSTVALWEVVEIRAAQMPPEGLTARLKGLTTATTSFALPLATR